jgi:hypothetical protein
MHPAPPSIGRLPLERHSPDIGVRLPQAATFPRQVRKQRMEQFAASAELSGLAYSMPNLSWTEIQPITEDFNRGLAPRG